MPPDLFWIKTATNAAAAMQPSTTVGETLGAVLQASYPQPISSRGSSSAFKTLTEVLSMAEKHVSVIILLNLFIDRLLASQWFIRTSYYKWQDFNQFFYSVIVKERNDSKNCL